MAVVGIGTDLVDVERFRRVVERTPGVLDRIFLDAAHSVCEGIHTRGCNVRCWKTKRNLRIDNYDVRQ